MGTTLWHCVLSILTMIWHPTHRGMLEYSSGGSFLGEPDQREPIFSEKAQPRLANPLVRRVSLVRDHSCTHCRMVVRYSTVPLGKKDMGDYSDFLVARPGFAEGAARLFDFAGALNTYNTTLTAEGADRRAISADWRAIGEDIEQAIPGLIRSKHARAS